MSLLEPYREFGEVWQQHQMSQKSFGGHWPVSGDQSVRTLSLMLFINRGEGVRVSAVWQCVIDQALLHWFSWH